MKLRVCIAGATGWAGSALSKGVVNHKNMELVCAVSRSQAGNDLAHVLNIENGGIPIYKDVLTALEREQFHVLVEYTKPDVAKNNVLSALEKGVNVVIGTSGLTIHDYEIIDYAHEDKIDSPSGTARELANKLSLIQESTEFVSQEILVGEKDSRGVRLNGVQVHSVRLPGYVISIESIFGLKDEKLSIRHDSGSSAEPYVRGALLAIEKVNTFKGLKRGLESVMEF